MNRSKSVLRISRAAFLATLIRSIGLIGLVSTVLVSTGEAQTDIYITGPKAGFPIAIPQLCDLAKQPSLSEQGGGGPAASYTKDIPGIVSKNLTLSGVFKVLDPKSFIETPGKCTTPDTIAYTDWSTIGAEALVKGDVRLVSGDTLDIQLYLYDVQQRRPVLGKRYSASLDEMARVAHRFSNDVLKYFTGESGVFGTKIAYVTRLGRFKELFMMDLDGSNVTQMTRDRGLAMSPSWSPTGDRIVYTSYRTKRPDLYYVSARGGGPKRVTKRDGLELGAEFSPDGRNLLVSITTSGISSIALLDLKGQIIKRLTKGSALDVSPSWSPNGQQYAFCSNRGGGPQIYVADIRGGRAKRVSFTDSNYCTSPAWSPKGDKIAFVCRTRANQLFVSSAQGRDVVQLTFGGNNEDPAWSPDGRNIVFSSNFGRRGPRNLALLPLLSGVPKQITFSKNEDSQPAWSPRVN